MQTPVFAHETSRDVWQGHRGDYLTYILLKYHT